MVERQGIDQRPEPQFFGALRDRGQEHARRRPHAERRRMVLGHVIGVEARAVEPFDQRKPIFVIVRERKPVAVQMIEKFRIPSRSRYRNTTPFQT